MSGLSPLGRAIFGKTAGDMVNVHAPGGLLRIQVTGVNDNDIENDETDPSDPPDGKPPPVAASSGTADVRAARALALPSRPFSSAAWRGFLRSPVGAPLASDPKALAIGIVLELPDREHVLDLVDDPLAGAEGLRPVGRGDADPNSQVADREVADAMGRDRLTDPETSARPAQDPIALAQAERLVGFVAQSAHRPALVVVADPPLERDVAAATGILDHRGQFGGLEGRGADEEHLSPPRPAE